MKPFESSFLPVEKKYSPPAQTSKKWPNSAHSTSAFKDVSQQFVPWLGAGFGYDLVLRHALDIDATGDTLAFGSTTGNLYVTEDQGEHWHAVTHHLPFAELLPPPRTAQWDFAKAYLGAASLGRTLLKHPHVRHAFCGHSHFPAEARVGHIAAVNIGSGYRWKTFKTLDL